MTLFKVVKTPCVGICSTGIGDNVCRGCKRFSHEVIHWNAYSYDQRYAIAHRLENFLTTIVKNWFVIVDEVRLLEQVKHQQILFKPEQNPYCWIYDLLKAGASQITDLSAYGVQTLSSVRDRDLASIRDEIERDYYALSCAHYDRYIAPQFKTH